MAHVNFKVAIRCYHVTCALLVTAISACHDATKQTTSKDIHEFATISRVRWDKVDRPYFEKVRREYLGQKVRMFLGFGLHEAACKAEDPKTSNLRNRNYIAIINVLASLPPEYRQQLYDLAKNANFRVIRQNPETRAAATTYANRNANTGFRDYRLGPAFVSMRSQTSLVEQALMHEFGHVFHMLDIRNQRTINSLPINDFIAPYADALKGHQLARRYVFEEWQSYQGSTNFNFLTEFYAEAFSSFYSSPTSNAEFRDPLRIYKKTTPFDDPMLAAYRGMAVVFRYDPVWKINNMNVDTISEYSPMTESNEEFEHVFPQLQSGKYLSPDGCQIDVSLTCPADKFNIVQTIAISSPTPAACVQVDTFTCDNSQPSFFCKGSTLLNNKYPVVYTGMRDKVAYYGAQQDGSPAKPVIFSLKTSENP